LLFTASTFAPWASSLAFNALTSAFTPPSTSLCLHTGHLLLDVLLGPADPATPLCLLLPR
jgi:hypothetical protein